MYRRFSNWWNKKRPSSSQTSDTASTSSGDESLSSSPERNALLKRWQDTDSEVRILRVTIEDLKRQANSKPPGLKKALENVILSKEEELWKVLGEKIEIGKQLKALSPSTSSASSQSNIASDSESEATSTSSAKSDQLERTDVSENEDPLRMSTGVSTKMKYRLR